MTRNQPDPKNDQRGKQSEDYLGNCDMEEKFGSAPRTQNIGQLETEVIDENSEFPAKPFHSWNWIA